MSRAALRESVLNPCPRIKSFPREMKKKILLRAGEKVAGGRMRCAERGEGWSEESNRFGSGFLVALTPHV
jgi:hypothetical protein